MPGSKPFLEDGTLVLLLRPNGAPFGLFGLYGLFELYGLSGLFALNGLLELYELLSERGSSPRGCCFIFCHAVNTFALASASLCLASGRCAVGGGGARKLLLVNRSAPFEYVGWCCGGGRWADGGAFGGGAFGGGAYGGGACGGAR